MSDGLISLSVAWASLISGVLILFHYVERGITPDTKIKVADWLKGMAARSISQTLIESPRRFIEAFDGVFGKKHLTNRCFLISCVASIMSVIFLTIIWAALDTKSCLSYFSRFPVTEAFLRIFLIATFLNIFPDYISLLETR